MLDCIASPADRCSASSNSAIHIRNGAVKNDGLRDVKLHSNRIGDQNNKTIDFDDPMYLIVDLARGPRIFRASGSSIGDHRTRSHSKSTGFLTTKSTDIIPHSAIVCWFPP
jgi:hypothetical protein